MSKKFVIFSIFLGSFLTNASEAQDLVNVYFSNDLWVVSKSEKRCVITANFANGSRIIMDYNSILNRARLIVISQDFISTPENSEYVANVNFQNNVDDIVKTYENIVFRGFRSTHGEAGVVATFAARDFSTDFARFDSMGLYYNENLVTGFGLRGSFSAIAALRRCDQEVETVNPTDPFSGQRAR